MSRKQQNNIIISVNNEALIGGGGGGVNLPRHHATTTEYDNRQQRGSKSGRKKKSKRKATSPGPSNASRNETQFRSKQAHMQKFSQSQYNDSSMGYDYQSQLRQQEEQAHQRSRSRTKERHLANGKNDNNRARSANRSQQQQEDDYNSDDIGTDDSNEEYDNTPHSNNNQNDNEPEAHGYGSDDDLGGLYAKYNTNTSKKQSKQKTQQRQQQAQAQQQQQQRDEQQYDDNEMEYGMNNMNNMNNNNRDDEDRPRRKKSRKKKSGQKSRTPNPQPMTDHNGHTSHNGHSSNNGNHNSGDYYDDLSMPQPRNGHQGRSQERQTQSIDKRSNKRTARRSRDRGATAADQYGVSSNGYHGGSGMGIQPKNNSRSGISPKPRYNQKQGQSQQAQQQHYGARPYGYTIDASSMGSPTSQSSATSNEYGGTVHAPNGNGRYGNGNGNGGAHRHSEFASKDKEKRKDRKKKKPEDRRGTFDVPRNGRQAQQQQQRLAPRGTQDVDYNRISGDEEEYDELRNPGANLGAGYVSPIASMGGDLGAIPQNKSKVLQSPKPPKSNEYMTNGNNDDDNSDGTRRQSRDKYKMTEAGGFRDEQHGARRRRRSASKSATPMPKNGKSGGLTPGRGNGQDKVQSTSRRSKSKKNKESKLNRGKLAEDYWIKEKMGKGNFAVVRRAIRKSDNREFAAKIISKKHLSSREIAELDNEVDILCKLYHPNVVEVVEVLDTPRHLYIVLELLTGGELFDRIVQKGRFTEQQAANITKQLASALKYLHSIRIVHRDLKPENIIYKTKSDDAPIKITDFGLGRDMGQDPKESNYRKTLNTACGTPGYVAPEILKAHPYDEYVDLWSCGVILYIMLCGYPPFTGGRNQNKLYRKIKRGEYSFPSPAWDNVSAMAKDCVKSLLTVDPRNRMSAAELLEHPWVQNTEVHAGKNLVNEEFAANLTHYLHKKRLRRGVELVIILNRMIRAAGLEKVAKEQRKEFRERLLQHKEQIKQQKYDEIEGYRQQGLISEQDYQKLNLMKTPPIDYSKV